MKTKSLKMTIKRIFIVSTVGLALTALAGCGHGSHQHGYNGRNYRNNADYNRSGYDYSGKPSDAWEYNSDNKNYGSKRRHGPGRGGN